MASREDEIRALKRELAGTRAQFNPVVRAEIMSELASRGVEQARPVAERRGPGRPKKSEG